MTESAALVRKLRANACYGCREAAAEIERLTAALADAERECGRLLADKMDLLGERMKWAQGIDTLRAAERERDALKEALRKKTIWPALGFEGIGRMRCAECGGSWYRDKPEGHMHGCLAARQAGRDAARLSPPAADAQEGR